MFKCKREAITITELLAVIIIISLIAGFGVPIYNDVIYKQREREMVSQLGSIHGMSQIYKVRYSDYWDTGAAWVANTELIDQTLGTTVVALTPVSYQYIGDSGTGRYVAEARYQETGVMDFIVDVLMPLPMNSANPCCRADVFLDSCPNTPECECDFLPAWYLWCS